MLWESPFLAVGIAFPCCGNCFSLLWESLLLAVGICFSLLWELLFLAVGIAFPCCGNRFPLLWELPFPCVGGAIVSRNILFYCCPGKSTEGAKDYRRGCEPPGQDSLTIVSPERATEYVTCLITTCLWLCRPFRTFSVVATLPGVVTPVCGLSSLRDF